MLNWLYTAACCRGIIDTLDFTYYDFFLLPAGAEIAVWQFLIEIAKLLIVARIPAEPHMIHATTMQVHNCASGAVRSFCRGVCPCVSC